jgi:hypothetical protein
MKEIEEIFSKLRQRLGIVDSVAIDTAMLEVQSLLLRQRTRPDSIVKVRRGRGGSDGAN